MFCCPGLSVAGTEAVAGTDAAAGELRNRNAGRDPWGEEMAENALIDLGS
jgi:hypothetical protein